MFCRHLVYLIKLRMFKRKREVAQKKAQEREREIDSCWFSLKDFHRIHDEFRLDFSNAKPLLHHKFIHDF